MTFEYSKTILRAAAFAAVAFFAAPAPGFAADAPALKVAVVDVQKLLTDSKAAKDVQKQLDTQRESFQQEIAKREGALRDTEKDLASKHDTMAPDEFAKKKQAFESDVLEARKLVQKRRQALEQSAGAALAQVRTEIVKLTADIATKQGYSLVLTRQNVVIAQDSMDITDEVLAELDKNMSKVKLTFDTK
jgi:Skp family chaperone for outer membrane proteins